MTRLFAAGAPVQATVNSAGDLVAFTWNGRRYRLTRIVQAWEVDTDWWDPEHGPVHRRYIAAIAGGLLIVLFQEVESSAWRVSRVYD